MLARVAQWFRLGDRGRYFEALQIEVTSRCGSRCVMCPRVALSGWPEQDLSWEAYERVARAFARTRHVHLQGWGEPLLHPRLFEMVMVAKRSGCQVGLTTNGMLLDADVARRLLDLGLDLVSISIAGATPDTHGRIRVGSDLPTILQNAGRLATLRAGAARPRIALSFLMAKSNLPELPAAVDLAAGLGADELYATNWDYVVTPEQEERKAFGAVADPQLAAWVARARGLAAHAGIGFRAYPLELEERAVCEANPIRILFVSSNGSISPCPYLGLPARTGVRRMFEGQAHTVSGVRFGSVHEQELADIWNGPAYCAFRGRFERRLAAAALATVGGQPVLDTPAPSAPEACRTCYKLYGA